MMGCVIGESLSETAAPSNERLGPPFLLGAIGALALLNATALMFDLFVGTEAQELACDGDPGCIADYPAEWPIHVLLSLAILGAVALTLGGFLHRPHQRALLGAALVCSAAPLVGLLLTVVA
jgi:hypothetical protein